MMSSPEIAKSAVEILIFTIEFDTHYAELGDATIPFFSGQCIQVVEFLRI